MTDLPTVTLTTKKGNQNLSFEFESCAVCVEGVPGAERLTKGVLSCVRWGMGQVWAPGTIVKDWSKAAVSRHVVLQDQPAEVNEGIFDTSELGSGRTTHVHRRRNASQIFLKLTGTKQT